MGTSRMYMEYPFLCRVQGHILVIHCTFVQMATERDGFHSFFYIYNVELQYRFHKHTIMLYLGGKTSNHCLFYRSRPNYFKIRTRSNIFRQWTIGGKVP